MGRNSRVSNKVYYVWKIVLCVVLIASHCLLSGCTYWVKSGASEGDSENALEQCEYEAAKAGAGGAGFIIAMNRGDVRDRCMKLKGYNKSFNKQQVVPVTYQQVPVTKEHVPVIPITYTKATYAKLGSSAFMSDYNGKGVSFRIMFIGEWTMDQQYINSGIATEGRIFINHRNTSYSATETGLGSSDYAVPSFAISVEKEKSDFIYQAKRGDIFEIKGLAQAKYGIAGYKCIHVLIHDIRKIK